MASVVDLGVLVTDDLSSRFHIFKVNAHANAIHSCFISKDIQSLFRAFLVC